MEMPRPRVSRMDTIGFCHVAEVSGGVGVARYRLVRYQPGSTHGEPNESGWAPIPVKLSVSFIYIAK